MFFATVEVLDMSETSVAENMLHSDCSVDGNISGSNSVVSDLQHRDRTVGEHFMTSTYEIPYVPIDEDVENGEFVSPEGLETYASLNHKMSGLETFDVNDRIDDDSDSDSETNFSVSSSETVKTAAVLNNLLRRYSSNANLIVTNMPFIEENRPASDFFNYVNSMCDNLHNVLLIRGSGSEVITTYA